MTTEAQNDLHRSSVPDPRPDLAADHARALLRDCGCPSLINDRARPVSAALEWARSGAMELTGFADQPPRFAAGALASAARGVGMMLQSLAPRSALSRLDAPALLAERAAIAGLHRRGDVSAGESARLFETRTGYIAVHLPRVEDWRLVPAWLEVDDFDFATARDWKLLGQLVAGRNRNAVVERGRLMGLAIAAARKSPPPDRPLFTLHRPSERPPNSTRRPLRLLDLTNLWAGPLATSLLAMTGIQVLKIESPTRPDGARRGPAAFFDLLNGNKQSCALDLHQPRDRSVFERLLEGADIVVESARARGLAQLGFDAESWLDERRGRLWGSITGYGRSEEWIAFGDDAAIAAGLAWSPDAEDEKPCFCGDAIADPLAGLTMAGLLLALTKSGRGGLLDLSLMDCAAHAASLSRQDLTLPLVSGPHGWQVIEAGSASPVAKPRARSAGTWASHPTSPPTATSKGERTRGSAPAVSPVPAPPNEAWLAEWTAPC